MSDSIQCPSCQRRLQLPAHFQTELVRCPSCEKVFPLASALPAASAILAVLPASEPREPIPAPSDPAGGHRPRPGVARRRSRGSCLIAAALVGGVLLLIGAGAAVLGVIAWRVQQSRNSYAVPFEENEEERRELLRQAFKDQKPLADNDIAQQVQPLFAELGAAIQARDAERIAASFDSDRMFDELISSGEVPPRIAKDRRGGSRGLVLGIGKSLAQRAAIFQWSITEIRHLKKLNNNEALVIARHTQPDVITLKMRWWLTRREGSWKVYDMENLDTASRLSSGIAILFGQGLGRMMEMAKSVQSITDAIQLVALNDVDGAEKKLAEVPKQPLPPRYEALRRLAEGLVMLHRSKNAEALKALEEAQRLQPDLPLADFLRGVTLNRLGKHDDALKPLQAYRDLLGDDAEICREFGEALRGKGRFPEAAKEYRKALDCNSKDAEAFMGLLRSLGGEANLGDVGRRFAQLDNPRENFDVCAADCESREFPQLLEPIVQAMHNVDPDYPPVDYYRALVQARTGKPDEAARSLSSALRKQPDEQQRQEYDRHFVKVMASSGHFVQAYAASIEPRQAFRVLAAEAVKRYRTADLKKLITAHAVKHAADPLLGLYRAEVHVREWHYAKADKAFAEAVARRPDAAMLQPFRASRVLARYHSGQAMSAYRDIEPREETFAQLALLFFQDGEDARLQTLLDAHAKDSPKSVDAIRFHYRLLIRQNKTAEGVALFKALLAKPLAKDKRAQLVSEFLWDMRAAGKIVEGYRAAPDVNDAFRQLANVLLDEDREDEADCWGELRQLVEAYRPGHTDDPWLAYYQSEVHQHEKAWDKAAKVLSEALKRDPKDARESLQWKFVYALYKTGRWQQAYTKVPPRDKTFAQLANLMAQDKKGDELETLVRAHRPNAPNDAALPYYEARAKGMQGKWTEAVPLFQQAYRKQTVKYQRGWYQSSFLLDLAAAGRWLEGYRAALDKNAALTTLAGQLLAQKKDKELAALLEEHHKDGGEGMWYSFYLGELFLLRGEAKKAIPYFAAALKKDAASEQWQLRNGLFRARIQAGEAVTAYEECKAREGTFASLASLVGQKKDAKQLQALLDAHRKVKPEDPLLISWELDLRWLKQDYEGVLRLLTAHREDVFDLPPHRWKANNYRVRCLVKLKRANEAVRAAEEFTKKRLGDRLLLVLAHAATADVAKTIAAMDKLGKAEWFVRRCYEDDDLGPILRSKPLAAFREVFPKPREKPSEPEA